MAQNIKTSNPPILQSSNPPILQPLAETLAALDRRYGQNTVMRLDGPALPCAAVSTGFPALDAALGVGGIPLGRVTDIYGPESSGKTALCLSIIAEAHQRGGWTLFIDTDHALDPAWAVRRWQVDPWKFCYAAPETTEQAMEITREVIRAGAMVVVVDSAASLVPQDEINGEMGDEWRSHGRLMSDALRNLVGAVKTSNTALIFTNQIRQNDLTAARRPGPTGGYALRFYASTRISLVRETGIRRGGQYIGQEMRATVQKNKVAPPFRVAEFKLVY